MKIRMPKHLEFVEIDGEAPEKISVEGREIVGDVRRFKDMATLYYDNMGGWVDGMDFNTPLYYMFRNVCREEDRANIADHKLRYDITIMLPLRFGSGPKEYNKTVGHYHPIVPGTRISYPELYEVIHGECYFIIQKVRNKYEVVDALIIKAERGDKIIIPPDYGHVMVNSGRGLLITANWVSSAFSSIYEPYREMKGACYYILEEYLQPKIVKNEAYDNVPEPKIVRSRAHESLNIRRDESMYRLAKELEKLDFLNHPQNHPAHFDPSVIFEVFQQTS